MYIKSINFIPNKLQFHEFGNLRNWQIDTDQVCEIVLANNCKLNYTIKKGYQTDFRSGPGFLKLLAPKIGENPISMTWLIHDVNYEGYVSRNEADTLVYEMLRLGNLEKMKAYAIYIGLRIIGGIAFQTHQANNLINFGKDCTNNNQLLKHEIKGLGNISKTLDNEYFVNDISQEIKINEFIDNENNMQQFSEQEKSELKSYLVEILPNEELDKLNSAFK